MRNKMILSIVFLLIFTTTLTSTEADIPASDDYMIDGNTVYIDNENVYMSATPHTIASSGWVYFNLTSKQYPGDIDVLWGFNTSVSKPTKAELYAPHWVNTTSEHSYTFHNVSHFEVYDGDDLDYGNPYNTFQYAVTYEVPISNGILMEIEGYEQKISNVSFDSQIQDGDNRIAYWHTRHDQFILWKDKTSTFNSVTHDYQGYNKWYYIKDVNVNVGQEYLLRAWVEVPISLTPQTGKFYFAVKPSDETIAQAIASGHFYALDPWWNSLWAYFKQIYTNQSMINQSIGTGKYPLLVSITDSHLAANTREDGHDIIFTDSANTTQLYHELKWNKTTGVLVAWVGVDDIKNVSSINMYYGNPDATNTQNPTGVWDANFDMVQHLNETPPGTIYDSTSNNNDGTTVGMDSADQVPGQIDGSLDFDGADRISFAGPIVGNNAAFTISGWINGTLGSMLYAEGYNVNTNWVTFIGVDDLSPYSARFYVKENNVWKAITIGTTPINGSMHYISVSQENKSYRTIYVDGQPEAVNTDTVGDMSILNTANIGVLERTTFAAYLDGIADEVRISDSSRSAAWTETEYNNAAFPELFISLGATQYYVDSLHYNASSPYNHTIESDGTITSNRSIIAADDTNDTALSTDISYLIITAYDNDATIVRNFTFTGDNLDWYQVANISGSYDMKNSGGIIETQTDGNFTTNLVAGTYWIEETVPEFIPPNPTSLANTTGNFWVNYTWSAGSGNVTDNYNVSYNGSWDNTSSNTFRNESVGAHGSLEIIVYAYNNTGLGTLSSGYITDNTTVPNNIPVLADISSTYELYENNTFVLDANHTDTDGDTITYSDNSSDWDINSVTGEVSWELDWGDVGIYIWRITIDDGHGGTDYQDFTVTVNGMQNTALTSVDTSFENGNPGTDFTDNTITLSFYLINSGSIDADISAKFTTNYGATYGLVSGTSTIGGTNFKLGNATLDTLLDTDTSVDLTDNVPGEDTQRNYNVQLRVPAGQNALSYSGTVELTFSDAT